MIPRNSFSDWLLAASGKYPFMFFRGYTLHRWLFRRAHYLCKIKGHRFLNFLFCLALFFFVLPHFIYCAGGGIDICIIHTLRQF